VSLILYFKALFFNIHGSITGYDLLKRPGVELKYLVSHLDGEINEELFSQIEIEVKYEGYIDKARKEANRMVKMEKMKLSEDLDYNLVPNLSLEARQKLNQTKPLTLGQASRISGINPSDIQVIAIYMKEEHK
jgi:tRNA uridine 5-carboxymethylaminomethyl modification enzyme